MTPNCSTCRFQYEIQGQLFCRRYPPTLFMSAQGQGSSYAPVSASQWCGEYAEATVLTMENVSQITSDKNLS